MTHSPAFLSPRSRLAGNPECQHRVVVALRVLNALAVQVPVLPEDVSELRSWAETDEKSYTLDGLALAVLQRILKHQRQSAKSERNYTSDLPLSA